MKGETKLLSSFPAMTEVYTQVDYFLWPAPPSEILRKTGEKSSANENCSTIHATVAKVVFVINLLFKVSVALP